MKNRREKELEIKKQFEEYRSPLCAYKKIEKIRGQYKEARGDLLGIFNNFIEVWTAIKVASILEARAGNVKVKSLPQKNNADAKISINDHEFDFQITQVMEEGRKRDKEYKEKRQERINGIPFTPKLVGDLFDAGEAHGADWIKNAVFRKVEKKYSPRPSLVVYANFLFEPENLDPQAIRRECQPYQEEFDSMWVITDKHYLLLFDNHDSHVFGPISTEWETMPEG